MGAVRLERHIISLLDSGLSMIRAYGPA